MDAKSIYQSIMRVIHMHERTMHDSQELRVYLLAFPEFEIVSIGRSGDEYLYFQGHRTQGIDTTLLLPATPQPIRIDIVDRQETEASAPRRTIGFLGNVGDKK